MSRTLSITRRNGDQFVVLVDDEDYETVVAAGPWHIQHRSKNRTQIGYVMNCRKEKMHRLLLPGVAEVDHINGDPLDNRKANLRSTTRKQNMENRARLSSNNTSGFRGATYNKALKKWQAQAMSNRRLFIFGYYDSAEEAGEAARLGRLSLFTHNSADKKSVS